VGINLYAYGLNNPLTVHDLYGLEVEYACPTMRSNEVQSIRSYSRAIYEFSAEQIVRPMDMFHMSIAPPNFSGKYVEPLKPSEVFLEFYRSQLDKVLPYNKSSQANADIINSTKASLDSCLTFYLGEINKIQNACQFACSVGTRALNSGMVQGIYGPIISAFSSVLNKTGLKDSGVEQAGRDFVKEPNNWTKGSLLKDKSAVELDLMFRDKKFRPKGPDPLNGRGNYVHPKSGRKYHIDPKNKGRYREPSHVDVSRSEGYTGSLKKKSMIYKDE